MTRLENLITQEQLQIKCDDEKTENTEVYFHPFNQTGGKIMATVRQFVNNLEEKERSCFDLHISIGFGFFD